MSLFLRHHPFTEVSDKIKCKQAYKGHSILYNVYFLQNLFFRKGPHIFADVKLTSHIWHSLLGCGLPH